MRAGVKVTLTPLLVLCAIALSICVCLTGCDASTSDADTQITTPSTVTVTDSAGREVTVSFPVERIVSLAPANTETLFELGLGESVVGVTTYDNYPAPVADITKAGDFISPNFEVIASLEPDLILATGGVQGETIAALEQSGAPVLVIDPMSIEEILASFTLIGTATGASEQAEALVARLREEVDAIQKDAIEVFGESSPHAFIEIGQNPLFTVGRGTLLDEMLSLAGGTNVVDEPGYVAYSAEQVITANPQVYFATNGSGVTIEEVIKREGFADITAVRDGRVILLDEDVVSRPGPRFVEGIRAFYNGLIETVDR